MERDLKIKFWTSWIKNLMVVNPIRSLIFFLAISFTISGLLQNDSILFKEIRGFFQDGEKCYYMLRGEHSYTEYNKPQKVFEYKGDNYLKVNGIGPLKAIFIGLGVALSLILIFSLFIEDLELKKILKRTIKDNYKEVYMNDINGPDLYYSISYNKVFFKSHFSNTFQLNWEASAISDVKEFFNCEDYFTQAELRDRKLSKLGIK